MTSPRVSVIMPCYNAAETLPWAIGSLLAQTFDDWECVLVDDGSTDDPKRVVDRAGDPRIRYVRLPTNMGRGEARRTALEATTGEFLCMLDADDWMYPSRIDRQVRVLDELPQIVVISSGMAIVDDENWIAGVRACGPAGDRPVVVGPVTALGPPPMAFPPCMVRMDIAKQVGFNPCYPTIEDIDFLLGVLLDRSYCMLSDVDYAYSEYSSVTLSKVIEANTHVRRMYLTFAPRFPWASKVIFVKTLAKDVIYRAAFSLGLGRWLVSRRSAPPTAAQAEEFIAARELVAPLARRLSEGG